LHLITQLDKNDKFLNSRILAIANRIYSGELKLVQNKNDQYRLLDTQNLSDISDFTMQELVAVQEVLWDDRMGKVSIGEKLKDADLLGMPLQLIVSKRSLENECLEVIERATGTKFEVRI
jgi:prolyl-tRNA synthetase